MSNEYIHRLLLSHVDSAEGAISALRDLGAGLDGASDSARSKDDYADIARAAARLASARYAAAAASAAALADKLAS